MFELAIFKPYTSPSRRKPWVTSNKGSLKNLITFKKSDHAFVTEAEESKDKEKMG